MTISFDCENCRKEVKAPDEAAGRRGKCPFCGHSNYIPAPVAEEEVLDLLPEDEEAERRRQAEIRRLLEMEKVLLEASAEKPAVPLDQRDVVTSDDVHHIVVNYCLDTFGSKLGRLRTHVVQLRKYKGAGQRAVEDFLSGKVNEPALKPIPPRTLQAFLLQLREELKD